ncbi:MAG TPA: hypothetical protein VMT27_00840, partial [Actinomycetes bacterium]|nr:hypothetical protein [Actinomycetes bacterium]
ADRLPAARYRVESTSAADAAAYEHAVTGNDRTGDYSYWAARPNAQVVCVREDSEVVAVGAMGGDDVTYGPSHFFSAAAEHSAPALLSALKYSNRRCLVALPGPHPALPTLVENHWRIVDVDQFVASVGGLVDPERLIPHSGLM